MATSWTWYYTQYTDWSRLDLVDNGSEFSNPIGLEADLIRIKYIASCSPPCMISHSIWSLNGDWGALLHASVFPPSSPASLSRMVLYFCIFADVETASFGLQ